MTYSKEEILSKLVAYCAYQERCKKDVITKLNQFNVPEHEYPLYLDQLISLRFLDEERFADSFVSGKFRMKKWGRFKIRQALRSKGLPSVLIDKALMQIDSDDYLETLRHLAEKKSTENKNPGQMDFQFKLKLMRYLQQKGYEQDLINDVVSELTNKRSI